MQRIDRCAAELPLYDVAHVRRIEALALAGVAPQTLMHRAGEAVARLALAIAPHAGVIRIVAGPGNNGGDGLEAAILLKRWGKRVEVQRVGEPTAADAVAALARARAAGIAIDPVAAAPLAAQDLAIDALLGIGARRPPEGALAGAIDALNALPCAVLAVDLPSGLDADNGQPFGPACVRAAHTLTLLNLKPGLFTAAGRDQAGTVWLDTLAVSNEGESPEAWLGALAPAPLAPRRHAQHKGSFGDVAVVGGAPGMTGAALLAARAAHAAGAGRVFVELLDAGSLGHDEVRPELMLRRDWTRQCTPEVLASTTVVCGCGGGDRVAAPLPRLLGAAARLVLDADALNTIAADAQLVAQLQARAARGQATVLTPHPLEAARLLGTTSAQVQADRLAAARELAERYGCVVVLKGSGSIVVAPGWAPRINRSGNAALASPGTGDVLAGWIGGDWSQRTQADGQPSALASAAQSTWLHGAAADASGRAVMRAAELVEQMAACGRR